MLEKRSSISHEFSPLLHFQYPRFLKFLNKIKLGRKVDKWALSKQPHDARSQDAGGGVRGVVVVQPIFECGAPISDLLPHSVRPFLSRSVTIFVFWLPTSIIPHPIVLMFKLTLQSMPYSKKGIKDVNIFIFSYFLINSHQRNLKFTRSFLVIACSYETFQRKLYPKPL